MKTIGPKPKTDRPRPLYENAETLSAEQHTAFAIQAAWGVDLHKLPISYHVDYAVCRQNSKDILGWLEVKKRDADFNTYPDIVLSVLKYNAGRSMAMTTGLKFVFAIELTDGIFMAELQEEPVPPIEYGGRTTKTRDSGDVEPVVKIPMARFEAI